MNASTALTVAVLRDIAIIVGIIVYVIDNV